MQELIEREAWLILTFSLRLHNKLISIHSTFTYQRVQMFEKCDSLNRQKLWLLLSAFQQGLKKRVALSFARCKIKSHKLNQ